MKKILAAGLAVAAIMLILPAVVFIPREAPASALSPFNVSSKTQSETQEKKSSPSSAPVLSDGTKTGDVIYKVYDYKTKKVLSLKASDYIKGVVAAEMPATYEAEALKAQAVASNTYALRVISSNNFDKSLKGAYFTTDPAKFQAYKSKSELKKLYKDKFDEYYKKISDAVDEVIDQVIVYKDEPIAAVFHAVSGGKTENSADVWGGNTEYLKSVDSPADLSSPAYSGSVSFNADKVKSLLKNAYPKIKLSLFKGKWFKIIKRSAAGGVEKVKVGNITAAGTEIRNIFDLKSANFSVSYKKGVFTFSTKGYGHGVGLSQYGANELAKQGKNYKEILLHYYSGVTIKKIN